MDERVKALKANGWIEYEISEGDVEAYVPVDMFGRDHWSTMLYLSTVEGQTVENGKMRVNPRVHRGFATEAQFMLGKPNPTRLKGGEQREDHDDWSCLEDMVAAGFIMAFFKEKSETGGDFFKRPSSRVYDCAKARVLFTEKGHKVINALYAHHERGKPLSEFSYKEVLG